MFLTLPSYSVEVDLGLHVIVGSRETERERQTETERKRQTENSTRDREREADRQLNAQAAKATLAGRFSCRDLDVQVVSDVQVKDCTTVPQDNVEGVARLLLIGVGHHSKCQPEGEMVQGGEGVIQSTSHGTRRGRCDAEYVTRNIGRARPHPMHTLWATHYCCRRTAEAQTTCRRSSMAHGHRKLTWAAQSLVITSMLAHATCDK